MNILTPRQAVAVASWTICDDPALIVERYGAHLADESRLRAVGVQRLHLPDSVDAVAAVLRSATLAGHSLTIAGGRTGIAGGSVPSPEGELLVLDRLRQAPQLRRHADGSWRVRLGPAITLAELDDFVQHGACAMPDGAPDQAVFYPVDATESSAQIGGTLATNASGARSFAYGPTRDWVTWLQVVLADGRILELERGAVLADDRGLALRAADGGLVPVPVVDLPLPQTKHTLGYPLRRGMDAIDLFIGSEGTLGVITAVELRLAARPRRRLCLMQFVDGGAAAAAYATALKTQRVPVLAIEYFGPQAIALVRTRATASAAAMDLARLPPSLRGAVYCEAAVDDEAQLEAVGAALMTAADAAGLDPAASWAGLEAAEAAAMRRLRHALPETVNALIGERQRSHPGLHKVGTDMAVPDAALPDMLARYENDPAQAGLEAVVFGHLGDGHLHLNILPRDPDDVAAGKRLYTALAEAAVAVGGSVAAEHGIGRIKRDFLRIQYDAASIAALWAVKRAFDPTLLLNPGVLLPSC